MSLVLGDLTVTGVIIAGSAGISCTITSATIFNSGIVYSSGVATNTNSCNGATSVEFTCPSSLTAGSSVSGNLAGPPGLITKGAGRAGSGRVDVSVRKPKPSFLSWPSGMVVLA
jgi:hypothetical protein